MDINTLNQRPRTLFKGTNITLKQANRVPEVSITRKIPQLTDQTIQEEGKKEQTKNEAMKKEEDKQTVNDLIKKSNRCIISLSSHFPWTLFPNTIDVEEGRVTFIFRQFLSSQSHSIDIKDISSVLIESSPFFATLHIVSRTYIENEITIGHLDATKACRVQMIIEGLRTFAEHNIDTSNYEVKELIEKIEEFHTNKTT
ncbi:MAG TPA: hypothetical protein VMR81_02660 [Patescibacteria group bacterium]|nr:hypothetical protein [Patescibacteria group bacterium]